MFGKPEYNDRKSRMAYVADHFKAILKGKILDVGADEGYIEKYLTECTEYVGIGLGGTNEKIIRVDLERDQFPIVEKKFDTVMCLDVLEHLENIHIVFDSLCSVSNSYVLVSLPNPWKDTLSAVWRHYKKNHYMKFYGLPLERMADRHKWFFSSTEADLFIKYRAEKNGFFIEHIQNDRVAYFNNAFFNRVIYAIIRLGLKIIHSKINADDFIVSCKWYVIKKKPEFNS